MSKFPYISIVKHLFLLICTFNSLSVTCKRYRQSSINYYSARFFFYIQIFLSFYAEFSLRFLNASKYHARGSNVWLLCSSHLNDSRTVEVRFHFRSHDNRTLHASCPTNQSKTISHHNGHWLVHRDHETHDCILEIRNVNKDTDAGEYQCNGSLPVNGRIEYDMSNQENLIVYNDSSPSSAKPFEGGSIIGIAIATGFVVLLLLVASVRVCVMICRRPPHPPPPPPPNPHPPHPNPPAANPPPPRHAPSPEGRGNGVAAVLLVDPPSASCKWVHFCHKKCLMGMKGDLWKQRLDYNTCMMSLLSTCFVFHSLGDS